MVNWVVVSEFNSVDAYSIVVFGGICPGGSRANTRIIRHTTYRRHYSCGVIPDLNAHAHTLYQQNQRISLLS